MTLQSKPHYGQFLNFRALPMWRQCSEIITQTISAFRFWSRSFSRRDDLGVSKLIFVPISVIYRPSSKAWPKRSINSRFRVKVSDQGFIISQILGKQNVYENIKSAKFKNSPLCTTTISPGFNSIEWIEQLSKKIFIVFEKQNACNSTFL